MSTRFAIALLALMAPLAAHAQPAAAPEPIVRATIEPPRVMVGQPATLRLEVLAPNYMTSPPQIPAFQLRNAVTRQLQSVNTNEQQNGVQYAGVQFEFAIYPLEPGAFAISGERLTVKYAAEPPSKRDVVLSLPRIEFQAFIPNAAAGLNPFLTATSLTVEQAIQRSSEQLKAGDAVTRIITVKAEGTVSMLLPPISFPAIDGLAVYSAQPALQDKTIGRSDAMSASRVDSATYMLEQPGDYVMPAIDVRWWNPAQGKIELAHLDAVTLQVAAGPAAASSGHTASTRRNWDGFVDLVAGHWLLVLVAAAVLTLLGWFGPRLARRLGIYHQRHRERRLQSEPFFFDRLRLAARRGDARAAYFALLDWLQRAEPPLQGLDSFKVAAGDPALDRELDALQTKLFAPGHEAADWSPRQLLRRVSAARRTLHRRSTRRDSTHALPQRLNPVEIAGYSRRQWRAPAR